MKESNLVKESAIHLYANISETQRFSRPKLRFSFRFLITLANVVGG